MNEPGGTGQPGDPSRRPRPPDAYIAPTAYTAANGHGALHGYGPPDGPPAPGAPPPSPSDGTTFLDDPDAPPASRRSAWLWLLMVPIGFAVGQIIATVFVAIAAAVAGQSHLLSKFATMSEPPQWYIGTSLIGLWVGFIGAPYVASKAWGSGRLIGDIGIRFRWVDLLGIAIGGGGQLVIAILYQPFIAHHVIKNFTGPTHKLLGTSHGFGFVVVAVMTVVGAPFAEEIFFRGLLFRGLARIFTPAVPGPTTRRAWGVAAAVAVDGLLFGLAHFELAQFAGLALFGMTLALVSYKTGRLGMNMVAHATFNLVAVIALLAGSGVVVYH